MILYRAEYALMTENFRQSKNIEVTLQAVVDMESVGVNVKSVTISEYYKFDNATMVVLELEFEKGILQNLISQLDQISSEWEYSNKSDPVNHRVLDLRHKGQIYSGAVWASFDLI